MSRSSIIIFIAIVIGAIYAYPKYQLGVNVKVAQRFAPAIQRLCDIKNVTMLLEDQGEKEGINTIKECLETQIDKFPSKETQKLEGHFEKQLKYLIQKHKIQKNLH